MFRIQKRIKMRFSLYTIVLWVSLLLSLNVSAQTDWQIIKYEDFEGVHRGGGWLTTTHQEGDHFMPVIHANSNAGVMAFQPADSSPFTLTNMPKIGFVVDLSPDYEYRFSADVATLLGQDMGIFISPVSVTGNTTTLLDATQTQLINTGGGGGLQSNWNPHLNTDVFTVDQAGVYFIYLQPTASQLVYAGLGVFYTTYDLYDNIKLEAKLTALPTTVSFIDHSISVSEGSTATICVEIEQPHANEETQVAIELTSPEEPHFTGIEPLTVTFPAGEVSEQCVDIDIPITSTSENSFFYDFNLLNTSSNEHAVVIGNDSELSLFVTKKNILNISSATQLSVAEGEMMEVCVSLSQSSPSFTSVSLYAMANASPHFINNLPVSFVLPPGQTELCQSIQVPFASATDNQSYQLQLQNISGTNVAIGSTNELEVEVIPSTLSECWEESINQGFSSNSSLNFSNEPDVVNHGFRKKNYGASGSYNDICAYVSNITGYYIGLKSYLEANKAYRLSCDIRTTSYDKELELYIGTSVASANVVSGSYHINASSSWQSLDMETFTVDADGEYVIFLKKAAGTAGGGTTKFDNFILEKDCTPYPTEVFFTQESYSVSEGGQVAICVDINNASADESTSVDVVFDNTHLPHFTNSSYTLNFPAASNQAQCVNLSIPVNGNLDGNISYPISLGNIISGAPAQIGAPASAVIEVQDDISYDDCNTWTEAVNDNIDNYYLLLPSNAFETSSSINLNNYYYLDYAGDKSIGGPYSTSFYVALHFDMQPNYEYRLKWDAKGIKKGSPLSYPDKVAQLMETKFGENRTSATLLDSSPAAATGANQFQTSVVSVNSAGSYTFVIEGGSSSSQTDIDLDNFILERRCIRTGVSIDIPASGLYTATEGEILEVCLNISAPSISQATEVTLEFVGESAPHFPAGQSYTASFPAGSTAQACVQIPSMVFGGADNRSAYQIAIIDVNGGVDAQAVDPTQANIQILDQTNCWNSLASENFSGANYSLTNVSDFVNNYSARKYNYGASGSYSDLCARMRLRSGKYIGFRKYLEAGKSYRQQWALKQETAAKEMFFAIGTSTSNTTQIGHAFTVPVLSNTATAMVVQSEYFTVPTSGFYYLVLRSNETNYNYTRFDDFELQERCPSAEVNFTQTDIHVQEGYPAQVCVRIDNPSATENTTATIAFANTQTPHFANSSPQTVTFLAGETQEVCITIPSIADGLINDQNSYELILTDASGNHYPIIGDENTLTIHIIDDIDLSTCDWAGPDQTICFGNTVQLGTDDLEWPCYSEKYCFNWVGLSSSNGATDQMPTVFPWQTRDYIVFVTDGEGHVFSDTVTITVNHAPTIGITTTDDFLCHGEEATLGLDVGSLSEPLSFEWSTGDTGGATTISQGGTYVLTVTDSDGCTSQSSIEIEQKEWPYELSAKSTFICEDRPSTILSIEGASIPATTTTTWSTGETDNEIAVSQAGTYSVAMHDTVNECDTTLTYTILDVDDLTLNLSTTTGAICPESNLTITANIAGLTVGEEEVTYLWNTGATTSSITIDEPGTYTVTVNFNEDCSLGQEIIITDDVFDFDIVSESGESFACPISPLTLMTQTTAGEISEWQWSTGEQSSTISVTSTDTYELSVTNVNSCVYTGTYSTTDCPTLISFSASEVEMAAGEEIEICLELANPNDQAASVDVLFEDTQSPHFTDVAASRQIDFAVGETYKCFMLQAQNIEDAPEENFYQLQLANASGGYQASIKEPSELAIKVENLIRCEVFQDSSAVNCALTDSTIIVTDIPLIQVLKEGDSFWAGDFEVEVQQATGSSVFNGEGVIRVPYFEQVQVNVRLDNVKINEACQMVEGEVIVEGVGAKLLSDEILDALNDALETLEDIDDALGVIDEALSILEEALSASDEMSNVLSEDWNVWQGSGPIQEEYPLLPDSVLNQIDEALLCYLTAPPAECNENLSQTIANLIQEINALFEADYAIRFSAYEEQAYGFDSLLYNQMSADYNKLTVAAKPYNVAWKSVEAGEADHVMVDKVFAELPTDLSFENNSQELILHSEYNGGTRLPVQSLDDEEIYQIYPVQTKQDTAGNTVKKYAGKLNVISYEDKPVDVVLVPVNLSLPYTISNIENQVNEIYDPAVVTINLSDEESFSYPEFNTPLDTTDTSFLISYNSEMRDIIEAYKDARPTDPDKYYLFVVASSEANSLQGFMPKGKHFGFIVLSNHQGIDDFSRTVAHELGHGAFLLNHTFEDYDIAPYSTDNLMDYGTGRVLHKKQWDRIHNPPSIHITAFDEEAEAQQVTLYIKEALYDYITKHEGKDYLSFVNNKGVAINIPYDDLKTVTFATGGEVYQINNDNGNVFIPIGTMTYFEVWDNTREKIVRYSNCASGTYYEYQETLNVACSGNEEEAYQNISIPNSKPVVLRHARKEGRDILHFVPVLNSNILHPNNEGSILPYDYFIKSFFNLQSRQVNYANNTVIVDYRSASLDEAFGNEFYKEFVAGNIEYVDYNRIESFYISGLAVLVHAIHEHYEQNCSENTFKNQVYNVLNASSMIARFATMDRNIIYANIDNQFVSETAKLLDVIYDSGFYSETELSKDEVAESIVSLIYTNERVDYFNEAISGFNNDVEKVDDAIEHLVSPLGYLRGCEYDALIFENYEDLELLIERFLFSSHYQTRLHPVFVNGELTPRVVHESYHENEYFDANNYEELVILKLISKIKPENYVQFFTFLETTIEQVSNGTTNIYYWDKLMDSVDDNTFSMGGFFGNKNGEALLKLIYKMYSYIVTNTENSAYKDSYTNLINNINTIEGGAGNPYNVEEGVESQLPIIPFNYTRFLNKFQLDFSHPHYTMPVLSPHLMTEAVVNNEGALDIYQRNKLVFYTLQEYGQTTIKPFDPIILDRESNFGDTKWILNTQVSENTNNYAVVPAITLRYLSENGSNQTIEDAIFTSLELLTILAPVSKISKVISYIDRLSGVVGVAGMYYEGTEGADPAIVQILNVTSAFLGLTGGVNWASVNKLNVLNKVDKSYVYGNNLAEHSERFQTVITHVEQNAPGWNNITNSNAYSDTRIRTYVGDIIMDNKHRFPDVDAQQAINILQLGALDDIYTSLKNALDTKGYPDSYLPNAVRSLPSQEKAESLKNFLLADEDVRLIPFHLSMHRETGQAVSNNLLTAHQYLDQAGYIEPSLDMQRLQRLVDDIDDHPDFLTYLNAGDNLDKWMLINNVNTSTLDKHIVEWIEDLSVSNTSGLSIGTPSGGGELLIKYEGDDILSVSSTGISRSEFDDFALGNIAYEGKDIKLMSNEANLAIVYHPDVGACIKPGACFVAGTPIHTSDGVKNIEDIEPEDYVVAFDEEEQDSVYARVRSVVEKTWYELHQLVVGQDTIFTTGDHPFYIPALKRYLSADSIKQGMQLLALSGTLLTVQSVAAVDTTVTVYNFEVEEQHNYFVGEQGVLVHNTTPACIAKEFNLINEHPSSNYNAFEDAFGGEASLKKELFNVEHLRIKKDDPDLYQELQNFYRCEDVDESVLPPNLSIDNVQESRIRAWEALSSFPTLSRRTDLLEVLEKIAPRFQYLAGSTPVEGFAGLKAVLTDHVSAQNFILNLKKADDLFGSVDDLTFSGIKTSQEARLIGEGNILGKIVNQDLEAGALVDAWIVVRNSDLSSDLEWLNIVARLQSHEVLFTPGTMSVIMSRNGYEFGEIVGGEMRILHDGAYGSVVLNKNKTVTIVGRLGYEAHFVNEAYGTHYFRWLKVAKVGKNIGGIDVLAIDNWDWAKNHAWIKAAIDNTAAGIGEVRFITPFDKVNIFENGVDASGSLTITGNEFAVMLKHGYGVDVDGVMKPLSELTPLDWWDEVLEYATNNPQWIDDPAPVGNALDVINDVFYNALKNGNENVFLEPAAGQTNFFGN